MIFSLAKIEDKPILADLFLKLLQALDAYSHEMLPTPENALWAVDSILLPAAMQGDPVLIAWEQDKPIGAIFWVIHRMPYQMRYSMAYGYGTYIEPKYRGKGIGSLLRKEGLRILKEKKVEKFMGMIHFKNKSSIEASKKMGWEPFALVELSEVK